MNNQFCFAAEKAVRQLDFIARSYHLDNWLKDGVRQNLVDDLATLLENNVLESVRLELRDEQSTVRFEFRIDFSADSPLKDLRIRQPASRCPCCPRDWSPTSGCSSTLAGNRSVLRIC